MKKKEQVEVLMETLTKIKNKLKLGNILSGWKMSNNILQNNKSWRLLNKSLINLAMEYIKKIELFYLLISCLLSKFQPSAKI